LKAEIIRMLRVFEKVKNLGSEKVVDALEVEQTVIIIESLEIEVG
jgi:hypothetical protein